jgi:hypothetical protein
MARKRAKGVSRRNAPREGAASGSPHHGASLDQVRVRMYRVGFGDCFLLTFPRLGTPFHMLIDCGVLAGAKDAVARMTAAARDIRAATAGRIDVLVVTHRHRDHLSGFTQARRVFEKIHIAQLWLGWTEDPGDREAMRLARKRGLDGTPSAETVGYLLSVGSRIRYWRGGDGPVGLPGVAGTRVFFLGPPPASSDTGAALAAVSAAEPTGASPFDEAFRIGVEMARDDPAFASYFGDGESDQGAWRRIGETPLEPPVPPLRLDSPQAVNDTSVVMAIELIGGRAESKVLLFPGDALRASWFSWHEHRWPPGAPLDDTQTITCRRLLERTVLYKVSQHGSRVGTPVRYGLDMMTNADLVAMIPVDEQEAKRRHWGLPNSDLLAALAEKTHGRVIRSDVGVVPALGGETGPEVEAFRRAFRATDLYLDYHVALPQPSSAEREKSAANWSAANERRVYLVDKKLAGTIRPEEEAELRELERLMEEYLSATAPTGLGLLAELRETVGRTKRHAGRE